MEKKIPSFILEVVEMSFPMRLSSLLCVSECRDGEAGQQCSASAGGSAHSQTTDTGGETTTETGQQRPGHTHYTFIFMITVILEVWRSRLTTTNRNLLMTDGDI